VPKSLPTPPTGYRLIRFLGSGAIKDVFEGVHLETKERVALKRYSSGRGNWIDPKDLTINFLDLKFHHRNLIPTHRVSGCWIAEPLLSSILSTYLPSDHRLTLNELLDIADGLLQGLSFLHAAGLVHGDIKPHNMGVQSGVPVLCDFGTASVLSQRNRSFHDYPGTIRTRPPELHARNVKPKRSSDTWMMAASFLALITGSYPFITEEQVVNDKNRRLVAAQTAAGIRQGEAALHDRILRSVQPHWLALLLCHALRFKPTKRITASEFHDCLKQQRSAPPRLLAGWPELRKAALDAQFQEDGHKVARLRARFARATYAKDRLLEEYLFEGLADTDALLSLECYHALLFGLRKRRLNSCGHSLRHVAVNGSRIGRVLALLLLHLAHPREFPKDLVIKAFSATRGRFAFLYSNYGHLTYHRLTLKEFLSFVDEEAESIGTVGGLNLRS
jgi:hypothetical protein